MLLINSRYESRGQANYSAHMNLTSGFEKYHAEQAEKQAIKQAKREANDLRTLVDPDKLDDTSKDIIKSYTNRNSGRKTLSNAFTGIADKGYKR